MPRQAPFDDSLHHPLTKVIRIRWPPDPASMLNQKPSDLGITNRFKLEPSRSDDEKTSAQKPAALICRLGMGYRSYGGDGRDSDSQKPLLTIMCLAATRPYKKFIFLYWSLQSEALCKRLCCLPRRRSVFYSDCTDGYSCCG